MIRQFFRSIFKDPPTKRFDPSAVVSYKGSHIGSNPVRWCDVTAHLASGQTVDLTREELENLMHDGLYFCGDHPLVKAMKKKR